jgi:hypothetical protein
LKRGSEVVNNRVNIDKDVTRIQGDSVAAVGAACSVYHYHNKFKTEKKTCGWEIPLRRTALQPYNVGTCMTHSSFLWL